MSEKEAIKERKEYVIKSKNPFKDARGVIDNYDLAYPINMANIITSAKGCLRANHFHPEQTQQALLISGKYISVHKDLINPNSPIHSHVVKPGDLVVTPPMVAHTMIFVENSTFLNLVGGNRDHDKFGEHTVPFILVSQEHVKSFLDKHALEIKS